MMMINKKLLLASQLLEEYSDELGKFGCNDWNFPSDWSEDDKRSIVEEMYEWNGNPEEFDPKRLDVSDFWIVSYMAKRLKEMAENDPRDE